MAMTRSILVSLFHAFAVLGYSGEMPLREAIWSVGLQTGQYFSIEHHADTPLHFWTKVDAQSATQGVHGLASALRRIQPRTEIFRSTDRSNVWHIVCLPASVANPVTQAVSMTFTGRIGMMWGGILLPLHEKVPNVDAQRTTVVGEPFDDGTSTAALAVTNKAVRDILTMAVELDGHDRIIWRSTLGRDGVSRVMFFHGKLQGTNAPKPVP